jgi:MinD-like ATPase involved in chromosome partitioning or flagellar assembly
VAKKENDSRSMEERLASLDRLSGEQGESDDPQPDQWPPTPPTFPAGPPPMQAPPPTAAPVPLPPPPGYSPYRPEAAGTDLDPPPPLEPLPDFPPPGELPSDDLPSDDLPSDDLPSDDLPSDDPPPPPSDDRPGFYPEPTTVDRPPPLGPLPSERPGPGPESGPEPGRGPEGPWNVGPQPAGPPPVVGPPPPPPQGVQPGPEGPWPVGPAWGDRQPPPGTASPWGGPPPPGAYDAGGPSQHGGFDPGPPPGGYEPGPPLGGYDPGPPPSGGYGPDGPPPPGAYGPGGPPPPGGYGPPPGPYGPPQGHQPLAPLPPTQTPPPPPPPQTADSLSAENLLRGRRRAPAGGWRKVVYKATAGAIHPGESPEEVRRQELVQRARTPVAGGHHRVAVMSLKGGVGKTTTTVGLGAMLATMRGDRVIAVDANPDRGTLSDKVRLETAATVRDLLNEREQIQRYADVRAFTSQASSRLEVLASDRDPAVSEAFSAADYEAVAEVLEHFYSICITDCGTGLLHSAMSGVLALANQLVLVSSPSVDGARSASATLDWLEAHHHGDLVRNGVVVLSMVRPRSKSTVDLDRLQQHFESRCRAVVRIPYDDHLEEGAEVELDQLSPLCQDAYLQLAAVVGDGFAWPQ